MYPTQGNLNDELPPSAAELALQPLLDAYARYPSPQDLTSGLVDICTRQPSATWQALSLLDRYHRRNVLSTALFRELKKELNAIAFGSADKYTVFSPATQERTSSIAATQSHLDTQAVNSTAFDNDTEFEVESSPPQVRDVTLSRELRVQNAQLIKTTVEHSLALRAGALLLDRYLLIEPLTSGGIGVVFKALDHQRSALPEAERYVAIKCLNERLQWEPRAIASLQHEYLQSQAISHPNIVKVYDFHQSHDLCFLSMELVEGESLSRVTERIAPRRLPLSSALAIVREIGHALSHAHSRGVVHGNLHPNNVILTPTGDVRVREFGQATSWLENNVIASDKSSLEFGEYQSLAPSATEMRYRSPQQQSAFPADATDDLYSLARIAHELLCGCTPDAAAIRNRNARPSYAKHLTAGQWQALQQGLAEDRSQRGDNVKKWLAELNLSAADIRLPPMTALESAVANRVARRFPSMLVVAAVASVIAILAIACIWNRSSRDSVANLSALPATASAASAVPAQQPIEAEEPDASTFPAEPPIVSHRVVDTSERDPALAKLPTVGFSQGRYNVGIDQSVAKLVVRRSGSNTKPLKMRWFTIPATAQPDIDYFRDGDTTVQLLPGQTSAEISIPLIHGRPRDRAVWFNVRIRATTDALPGELVVTTVYLPPNANVIDR